MKRFLTPFALLFVLLPMLSAEEEQNTRFSLIAEHNTFRPGDTVWLGARFEMNEGWHIYWESPGDSGMPTTLDWTLPPGFSVGEKKWPAPIQFIEAGILVSYGYKNEVILLIPLQTPSRIAPGTEITLSAFAEWLECKDICLPGEGTAEITLTAGTPGPADPRFDEVRRNIPQDAADWQTRFERLGEEILLTLTPPDGGMPAEGGLQFFPQDELLWQLLPGFPVTRTGSALQIRGTLIGTPQIPDAIRGVLVHESGMFGEDSPLALQFAVPPARAAAVSPPPLPENSRNLLGALLGAFAAGVMLNLLPCIFPVLGLKISGFVEQAQGDPRTVKLHSLVFTAGILVSLWILGAIVGALGAAWGAQFQDPRVVIALLLVLTLFTMNLFGVFEMGNSLTTVGGDLTRKQGYGGSFFQGVLLTVIATPCTGPFMAAMIGWMLTQTVFVGFLAFTAMGLGIASPYVVMAFSPKLVEKLPPPGMWMVTFKQGSAFLMVLFLWGLLFVLNSLQPAAMPSVLGAMLLVCFAAWVLGTWGAPHRKTPVQRIGKSAALGVLLLAAGLGFSYRPPVTALTDSLAARFEAGEPVRWTDVSPELAEELTEQGLSLHFRPFSPELVASLRAEGTPVFIDFTAEWCTICKINKFTTLHRDDVMRAFQERGVVTLRADWTARDDIIAETLARYGRRGVPVYLLYPADGGEPQILPEQLNPGIIFEALDTLSS